MTNTILEVKNLTYRVPWGNEILKEINFKIFEGEFVGLLGENGAGKTTLIELILGMRNQEAGNLFLHGAKMCKSNPNDSVCYLSHDINILGSLKVRDFLKMNSLFYPNYSLEKEEFYLKYFSVAPDAHIASLSTGIQKKIQIIACLSSLPKLLIIDEITAVLDPKSRSLFFNALISEQKSRKMTILLATNIAEDLIQTSNRILYIQDKKITEIKPSEILSYFEVKAG